MKDINEHFNDLEKEKEENFERRISQFKAFCVALLLISYVIFGLRYGFFTTIYFNR
jgi:F0F1-type ATP synthase assembly protein I